MARSVVPPAATDGLISAAEVCARLHVNDETLRAICARSRFLQPEIRPGKARWFREASLARYLELERPLDQVTSPDRDGELRRAYRATRPRRRAGAA